MLRLRRIQEIPHLSAGIAPQIDTLFRALLKRNSEQESFMEDVRLGSYLCWNSRYHEKSRRETWILNIARSMRKHIVRT